MKKRFLVCLLAALCCLFAVAAAEDGVRYVVKCNDWVSLRATPSTKAARLAPGAAGRGGDGLRPCRERLHRLLLSGADGLHPLPVSGKERRAGSDLRPRGRRPAAGNVRVVIEYGEAGGNEAVRATGYDFGGAPLWQRELVCGQRTELALVEGFFAGTQARPLVMLYAYGDGSWPSTPPAARRSGAWAANR